MSVRAASLRLGALAVPVLGEVGRTITPPPSASFDGSRGCPTPRFLVTTLTG